mmetsp:Transcript_24463/g.34492  ORF Transcript_24463/g.34492 Transcript_24463/m.34492 type:complete len:105 (+) Transcript_24463:348-662(+)
MVELETTSAADTSLPNGATTAAPKSEPTTIKTVSVSEFVDASFASFDRVYGDSPTSRKSVSALKDTTNSSSSSSSNSKNKYLTIHSHNGNRYHLSIRCTSMFKM